MNRFPDIIILAGGFGTRLKSLVKDVPKPMAPVVDRPFLEWLIDYIVPLKPSQIILGTGYKHEIIESHFGKAYKNIAINYSVETTPLGTGGAIKKAMNLVKTENCMVLNGDTFFKLNYKNFLKFHLKQHSFFSMALKPMVNPSRYGTVEINHHQVINFYEKNPELNSGHINTGVYLINKTLVEHFPKLDTFSLEKDFLEKSSKLISIQGYISDDYFIDIGIPSDYIKANNEFQNKFD